jgi:hypothetical protein
MGSRALNNSPKRAPGINATTVPIAKPFNTFIVKDFPEIFCATSK